MDIYLLDWVNLLLRWAHVITAMAWVGASFYFVLLDASLTPTADPVLQERGVDGELWAVHGGGFYHSNKYMVSPRWLPLPRNLHWSYWESYSTWLTGFALFMVMYLFNASTFLVDKRIYDWEPSTAIAAALSFLIVFWVAYDAICRSLGRGRRGGTVVGVVIFCLVVFGAWLACQLFAGRAAFLIVGAMMATAMSANVFFWIIPGQRTVVAQMRAGRPVDPIHGQRGKQRSVHNTYFTLPVIIAMLSNHYGWLYQGPQAWVVLVLLMLAGALIRYYFVSRHRAHVLGAAPAWKCAVAGILVIVGLVIWLAPAPPPLTAPAPGAAVTPPALPATLANVKAVVDQRCVLCHNAQLQNKGVALHTAESIKQHAQQVYQQAAVLKLMPLNNATQITPDERDLIKRWFEAGAPAD